jgi:hypothetical protein
VAGALFLGFRRTRFGRTVFVKAVSALFVWRSRGKKAASWMGLFVRGDSEAPSVWGKCEMNEE